LIFQSELLKPRQTDGAFRILLLLLFSVDGKGFT